MATGDEGLLRTIIPKIPLLCKTALLHTFRVSHTSSKWDLRTELTMAVLRSILDSDRPLSVTEQQSLTLKDPGIKGRMWISKVSLPRPPEDDARRVLLEAIDSIKEGDESYTIPSISDLSAEWTGYRAGVCNHEPEARISESEKYTRLVEETTSDAVILYFHGGAYYLCDPCSHRPAVAKLCQMTGFRALSIRYRLAPQYPFPAALLDALIAYLYLLAPPIGSLHTAIPANKIIFAGDSAGGNICLALLQTLLQIHRTSNSTTIPFFGTHTALPLPAGLALTSPWTDITRSLPSIHTNQQYDYLPTPETSMRQPPCPLWPTTPTRSDLFCETSILTHPLVSPIVAKPNLWTGAPPVLVVCGEETLADEDRHMAAVLARSGVRVVWEQYEAMPHCFGMVFPGLKVSKRYWESLAGFCRMVVSTSEEVGEDDDDNNDEDDDVTKEESADDDNSNTTTIKTKGTWIATGCRYSTPVPVETASPFSDEEVMEMLIRGKDSRERGEGAYKVRSGKL
ncbi:MAG: hypothetical protein M1834_000581 [Cirrosporium novae-zelandiae]|nr:MAG: hypothetical protein M1834_000581 [Cirrosporium novae-zelandiae]